MSERSERVQGLGAMSGRPAGTSRDRVYTVVGCAAGAGLALFAAGRAWVSVTRVRPAPLPPLHEVRTGSALLPWLPAVALVALAGAGAVLATRGLARAAVGVLLVLCGVGIAAGGGSRLWGGWPVATVVGGLLVASAGAAVLVRGKSWPGMAARYDRPASAAAPAESMWDALDRGDDPTR